VRMRHFLPQIAQIYPEYRRTSLRTPEFDLRKSAGKQQIAISKGRGGRRYAPFAPDENDQENGVTNCHFLSLIDIFGNEKSKANDKELDPTGRSCDQ